MALLNHTSRLNQILIGLLTIQIALGVVVFWPGQAAGGESPPLLAGFTAADAVSLTISDNLENQVTLARQGDGWVLPESGDYPANDENITSLLEKIEGVQTNRLVTQTDASHKRLQVADDDFNRRVVIIMADGSSHDLFIGSQGGAGATHVRTRDQAEVYLASNLNPFDANTQVSGWIDTLYFEIPQTDIVGLTLENGNGTFQFAKNGEVWTLLDLAEGEIFNEGGFTTLLGQVSNVRMTRPIGTEEQAAFGLSNPAATVTLQTAGGPQTLILGPADPNDENSYVLKASTSAYFVQVAAFTGNNFANKTRLDFLQEPPIPEVESGPPVSE